MVNAAKNSATGAPGAQEEMTNVTDKLLAAVDQLVSVKPAQSSGTFNPTALGPEAVRLVNSVKGISSSANQLLNVSRDVTHGKKEKSTPQPQLAASSH